MRLIPNLASASGRPSSVVALEISADAIVALERVSGDAGRERRALSRPLPVGIVTDGEVTNAEALAAELSTFFAAYKLPRDVRVGLAHPRLIVRMVDLPAGLEGTELDSAVRHLSEDLLPMALDDVVLDYRRAGTASAIEGHERILVAAVRRDGVDRLTEALELAGLRPVQIQVSGLALLHALQEPPVQDKAVVYVQAGALTNVVIAEDNEPFLVRAASAGSEAIAAGLAERAGIDHQSARRHAATIGLGGEAHSPEAQALVPVVDAQVRDGLRRVVAEIQSSLEFYASRPEARSVGAVVLTGPMIAWPGVAHALEQDLGLPVLPADRATWPRLAADVAPESLDVAVGLLLAPPDERPDLRAARRRRGGREVPANDRVPQVACAMVALLAAAVVYLVVVSNQVTSGQERLNQVGTELVSTERQAAELKPYADFATATAARRVAVSDVAASRFNWERGLRELAQVTPRDVWLTSVKGTTTPTTALEGAEGGGDTSSLRAVRTTPAFELSGCAVREDRVPDFMDRLRRIHGATDVGFSRSERLVPAKDGSSEGGDDCRNGDERAPRFDVVTFFKPLAAPLPVADGTATAAPPATGAAPPSQAIPAASDTTTAKVKP